MDRAYIERAAARLADARRNHLRIESLPASCRPTSAKDAHEIQDAVATLLGATVGAFKATAPSSGPAREQPNGQATYNADAPWLMAEGVRALIFQSAIYSSPADVPSVEMPECGVEGEVAFRFRYDLLPRSSPFTRDEIATAVDAYPAIEVVSSRFAKPESTTFLERLADCVSNGGFVHGHAVEGWHELTFAQLRVTLTVNGGKVVEQVGGHPTGDPFAIVMALVEMMRMTTGIRAGQFVTCGSFTGLRYLKPEDACEVSFQGLGAAQLTFKP